MLIGSSNWNIEGTGSRLPARTGGQIEEGLEGSSHADLVVELEHSKRRIKVACPHKPDRGKRGMSQPF